MRAQLRVKQLAVSKLREQKSIQVDPLNTAKTEKLTEKWIIAAQEVLAALLDKLQFVENR